MSYHSPKSRSYKTSLQSLRVMKSSMRRNAMSPQDDKRIRGKERNAKILYQTLKPSGASRQDVYDMMKLARANSAPMVSLAALADVQKGAVKYVLKKAKSVAPKKYGHLFDDTLNTEDLKSVILPQKTADYVGGKAFEEGVKYLGGSAVKLMKNTAITGAMQIKKGYSKIRALKKVRGK